MAWPFSHLMVNRVDWLLQFGAEHSGELTAKSMLHSSSKNPANNYRFAHDKNEEALKTQFGNY